MVRNGEVSRFGHESYEIGIRLAGWIQKKILNNGIRTLNYLVVSAYLIRYPKMR